MQLKGRVAVITGAGTGIGRSTAILLAKEGAAVVVAARTTSDLDSVVQEITAAGGKALAITTDVSVEEQAEALIAKTLEAFGRVDILVNNAGTNVRAPIDQVKTADWNTIIGSNLNGTFFCTRAVVGPMKAQGFGKIINVSSGAGKRGSATRPSYSAAKHGVVGFGDAVAKDLKETGIAVTTVLPGPILTPLRRRSVPDEDPNLLIGAEEVAEVILFLSTRGRDVIIPEVAIYPRAFIPA
ncbi:MAG: SDR family NAD(P)-dependent oxidoreductase [Chloroflexi bacterium]|nr:SDR family NAD(P)-dependent oxidoreductase [Chloroflexota bacterium]